MPFVGDLAIVPSVGYALGTTSVSSFTTTETVTDTITTGVTSGKSYLIRWMGMFQSSVAGDSIEVRIREDALAGTSIMSGRKQILATGTLVVIRALWTAGSTINKTFVVTGKRVAGSGNIGRYGASDAPSTFTVEFWQ